MRLIHTTLNTNLRLFYCLFIIMSSACEDPIPPPPTDQEIVQIDATLDGSLDMELTQEPDSLLATDMSAVPQVPPIGWIELNLSPTRSFYTLSDQAQLTVNVYNVYGEPLEETPITYNLSYILGAFSTNGDELSLGVLTTEHQVLLNFFEEGKSDIIVCTEGESTESICVQNSIIVDDSKPSIDIAWPSRGQVLSATDPWPSWTEVYPDTEVPDMLFDNEFNEQPPNLSNHIPIYGQVGRLENEGTVTVNGEVVQTDERGFFTAAVPSKSGFIEVTIVADDGIRFTPNLNRRWILFAADYIPHSDQSSIIQSGLELSISQSYIDDDHSAVDENPYQITEIAQLINLFLDLIDPSRLIAQPTLVSSPELTLSMSSLELGRPNIDLQITDTGLSLFVDLNRVDVDVAGQLQIGTTSIDLNGNLIVGVSAFADYDLRTGDDPLEVQYLGGGVAVTHITPQLNEEAANTVISVLDSTARGLIVEQIESQMLYLVRRDIPQLLELAVADVYRSIRRLPLNISSGFEGSPDVNLDMLISPRMVSSSPLQATTLTADVEIDNSTEDFAHEASRGIPRLTTRIESVDSSAPVSFKVKPEVVNAILVEIWRSGVLDIRPPLPTSAALFYSDIKASALSPPVLTIGRSTEPYPMYLELGALRLELTQTLSGMNDVYEVYIRVGGSLVVEGGTFTVQLENIPKVEVTLVELGNDRPAVTERLISTLFSEQIWPSLSSSLISRLVLGIPDSPLQLNELSYLGINLQEGWLRPRFDRGIEYQEDWIIMDGLLLFDFP